MIWQKTMIFTTPFKMAGLTFIEQKNNATVLR